MLHDVRFFGFLFFPSYFLHIFLHFEMKEMWKESLHTHTHTLLDISIRFPATLRPVWHCVDCEDITPAVTHEHTAVAVRLCSVAQTLHLHLHLHPSPRHLNRALGLDPRHAVDLDSFISHGKVKNWRVCFRTLDAFYLGIKSTDSSTEDLITE